MKSCLKSNNSFSNKPKVRFESDHKKLEKVKIFKMTDTPNAPNITREEYLKIQKEISLDPHIFKIEDRSVESTFTSIKTTLSAKSISISGFKIRLSTMYSF